MMTRKDYIKTAEILNTLWNNAIVNQVEKKTDVYNVEKIIFQFAEMFVKDNPNFDKEIFFKAVMK
jgi:tetraacyldisaccharide-1-P 4'-kinase